MPLSASHTSVTASQHAVNAQVDAVFVLSVKSFHDRIAHITRELKQHGITFEWIFEHDADQLSDELIESRFAPSDMGKPQQSLVMKHIETWRRCVERGYRRVLVFEDDVVLSPQFQSHFTAAMREAARVERPYLIYLGCGDNKYVRPSPGSSSALVPAQIPLPATDAIVFDDRAARLRLQYIEGRKITRPSDWLMREADSEMGVAHYWLADPIVEQGSMNGRFASVLDRKRIGRGRAWSWLRFRWDRWRRRTLARTPDAINVAANLQARDRWAITTARVAAGIVAVGAFMGAALANIAAAVMLLAFLLAPSCRERVKRAWQQPLGMAAVVFLGVLLLSTLWSSASFTVALKAWTGWRSFLWMFIALAIFDSRAAKLTFAALFVVPAAAAAVASFFAFDFGPAQELSDVKGGIILRNHVTQGMALTIGALLALLLAMRAKRGSAMQWIWIAAAVLMVANVIFVAYGRSGYVVLAITSVAAVLGLWRGRARGIALLALIALTLGAIQFSPLINKRFDEGVQELQSTNAPEITSMGIRRVMWQTTAEIVRDAPLFGYGLGSYTDEYRTRIVKTQTGWKATLAEDPHNQYLLILAETGLLGLAVFAWFLFSAFWQPVSGPFRVIGIALLLAWCVTSLFSSHFHVFNEGHLIAILLGVCLAREARSHGASAESIAERTSS